MKILLGVAAFVGLVFWMGTGQASDSTFLTIGTGGVTGVYYPTGGAIARLVNKGRKDHGIRCSVESTDGSVYNLNAIAAGDLDMGIAQSDWQYHAWHGTSDFAGKGPDKELRVLFSLQPELFTVVARVDSGIKTFRDLKGKRVSIGNPGSGQRSTMEVVMGLLGMTTEDFRLTAELKSAEQAGALCDNKIDAFIFIVGHPSGSIRESTIFCDSVMVPLNGPDIEHLVAEKKYYQQAVIPAGMYRGTDTDTQTFGVGATFVSSTRVSQEVIYQVVKAVFENFEDFKQLHPALKNLKKQEMVQEGLFAPFHPGALRYYKEAGLM